MPVEMAMWRMTSAGPQLLESSRLDFEERLERVEEKLEGLDRIEDKLDRLLAATSEE